jgi:hypothetical protein
MEKLAEALRGGGVDVSSLGLLFETPQEKVYELTVPGTGAMDLWRRLRSLTEQTGHWPVLLGDEACVQHLRESVRWMTAMKTATILEDAATIDPVGWFENRHLDEIEAVERAEAVGSEHQRYYQELLAAEGPLRGLPQGPWPEDERGPTRFVLPFNPLTHEPLPRAHLALLPTVHGWQAPAFLRFGAFETCPSPGENVVLLKYWHDLYGAEVVGLAGDVLELQVTRPPRDRDQALALARQQFLYCRDIVTRELLGVQTIQRLAARLLNGGIWFFMWLPPEYSLE